MFKWFWGKTFLINHYKFLIVSSEQEKINIFKHLKWTKYLYNPIFLAQIMKFPDFLGT